MLGSRTLGFVLPFDALEYERRLERLLAKPTGRMHSGELTFTGRVADGQVLLRVRLLARQSLRLRVEGRYESTPDGVAFRGRTVAPPETFLPLLLLLGLPFTWLRDGRISFARSGAVGLACFSVLAVAVHLYLMLRMGDRVERTLRELGP